MAAGKKIRLRGIIVFLPCFGVLVVGFLLQPRKSGYGTHMQLGMTSCGFKARTGYPCPACGLTTSVSAMTHGHIAQAWEAHPFGVVFALALLAAAVAGVFELVAGVDIFGRVEFSAWWVIAGGGLLLAGWAINLLDSVD